MSILDVSFNLENSVLVVGTDKGFIVYKLNPDIEKYFVSKFPGGIGKVSILNETNAFAIVGGGNKPFKLKGLDEEVDPKHISIIWDDNKKIASGDINMGELIHNVILANKSDLVIVTRKEVCIYKFFTKNITTKKITRANSRGICAVAKSTDSNESNIIIATLGLREGELSIWRPHTDSSKTIQAHNSAITCLTLNKDGSLVASASKNATNVHVYNTVTKKLVHKFRRNTDCYVVENGIIHDIAFDPNGKYLACCSSNGTIHIWDMNKNKDESKNQKSMFSSFGEYVEYFKSNWARFKCKIGPTCNMKCGFDKKGTLHIATYDGDYFQVNGPYYTSPKRVDLEVNNI